MRLFTQTLKNLVKTRSKSLFPAVTPWNLPQLMRYNFSSSNQQQPPKTDDHSIQHSTAVIGGEQVDMYHTQGAISIIDKVQGIKADNKQLYVLSFTCNKCGTKNIRSFTKHSYHKGIVMVRCSGCQSVHLVADNIGWFEDKTVNLDNMYQEGQVKKIKDPILIGQFLKKAFEEDQKKQQQRKTQNKQGQTKVQSKDS